MLSLYAYVAFGIAMLSSLAATRTAIAMAFRYGIVNHPNPIVPQHTRTVAYFGGVGIAAGTMVTLILYQCLISSSRVPESVQSVSISWGLVVGMSLFLLVGLLDDIRVLAPAPKFVLQLAVAVVTTFLGVSIPLTGMAILDLAFSSFWIVVLVNGVNLIDVCDGLVGGIALLILLFFAHFGHDHQFLALVLAGACAGFLCLNLPPARVFLGDAGSHLLGFLLATYTLSGAAGKPHWSYYAAMVLVVGVPLFELTFLTVVRMRKGIPFWVGSQDHFSLRLQAAGLTRWQTNGITWLFTVLLCGVAWMLSPELPWLQQTGLVMAVAALFGVCWRLLLRWEVVPVPHPVKEKEEVTLRCP